MGDVMGAGIVGMGWASGEHFKAYQNNPHTEMKAVVSRTVEGAEAKLKELGEECRVCASYEELLADPEVQIISICSPPSVHVEQTIAAAEAGKHICIEKPVALDLEGLRAMQKAVGKAGVKTVVCFECHWNPELMVIKSILDQGLIGNVFYAEADYLHGIGPWYKQWAWNVSKKDGGNSYLSGGCHALDAVMYLVGSEVVEVCAFSNTSRNNPLQYEYDPNAVAVLKFENGVIGKCASSVEYRGPYYFPIMVHGDCGHIRNNQLWSTKMAGQTGMATIPTVMLDSGDVTHHPYQHQINDFVDCILRGQESHLNLDNAAKVFEVIFAADISIAEKRVVALEQVRRNGG